MAGRLRRLHRVFDFDGGGAFGRQGEEADVIFAVDEIAAADDERVFVPEGEAQWSDVVHRAFAVNVLLEADNDFFGFAFDDADDFACTESET